MLKITWKGNKMQRIKWYQYFGVGAFVAGWIMRAAMDGKISRAEIEELIMGMLDMLGLEDISIE